PSYMSPETAAGRNDEVDEQSDIFLLGACLYEILTGQPPRKAENILALIKKAVKAPPVSTRKIKPDVPKALDAICMKALAFRKDDRYRTALELTEDVQRYLAGEPVSAYREGLLARAWRWARRHRTALMRSAAAVLIVGIASVAIVQYRKVQHEA